FKPPRPRPKLRSFSKPPPDAFLRFLPSLWSTRRTPANRTCRSAARLPSLCLALKLDLADPRSLLSVLQAERERLPLFVRATVVGQYVHLHGHGSHEPRGPAAKVVGVDLVHPVCRPAD